ncbi:MAG: TolC family protein [Gemmatimonadota bacterium]
MTRAFRWATIVALCLTVLPGILFGQDSAAGTPLSLEAAVQKAIPASEAIGLAVAERLRASGQIHRAYAEFLPQLTLSAQYTRQIKSQYGSSSDSSSAGAACTRFTPQPGTEAERLDSLEAAVGCLTNQNPFAAFSELPFARPNQYNFGISFSQTLFNGSVRGRVRAAKAGRTLAELGITSAQSQLVLDVTTAYYDALLAEQLVSIAQLALDQSDTTLAQTSLGERVGSAAEFDVLRARVSRDNNRVALIQQRASRDVAFDRIKQLVLLPLDQPVNLTTPLASGDSTAFSMPDTSMLKSNDSSVTQRNAVQEAQATATIQEIVYKIAAAEWWPSLNLTSRYSQLAYPSGAIPHGSDFRTDWNVGVLLNFPVWTSGRFKGDAQIARADYEQSVQRLSQARKAAVLDNRQVIARLQAAHAAWTASFGTVEQAERAYHIAEIRYREGLSTQTELNDSRLALAQAQVNRATAARDFRVALTRLQLLPDLPLGGSTAPTAGPVITAPPTPATPARTGP